MTPPLLILVQAIKQRLQTGRSTREALRQLLSESNTNPSWLVEWWTKSQQGHRLNPHPDKHLSALTTSFLELMQRGCDGHPILEPLVALESEVLAAAEAEIEGHVATLPFKMLIPLMAFQFPAYLLLLMGPALRELQQQMGMP